MKEPLEAHQCSWHTKQGLFEGLSHLRLDNDVLDDLLKGSVSEQIDTLIAHHPPAELKIVLIGLYGVAGWIKSK